MCRQHATRAASGARQFEHAIADLAAERSATIGVVEGKCAFRDAGFEELAADVVHDGGFLAATAGDRHHFCDERKGFGVTNLVVLDRDGSPIIDEQITVVRQATSTVRIYRRSQVQTMSCTPYCEGAFKSEAERLSETEISSGQ